MTDVENIPSSANNADTDDCKYSTDGWTRWDDGASSGSWSFYNYKAKSSVNGIFSMYSMNALFSFLSTNSFWSLVGLNAFFSILACNSFGSILSVVSCVAICLFLMFRLLASINEIEVFFSFFVYCCFPKAKMQKQCVVFGFDSLVRVALSHFLVLHPAKLFQIFRIPHFLSWVATLSCLLDAIAVMLRFALATSMIVKLRRSIANVVECMIRWVMRLRLRFFSILLRTIPILSQKRSTLWIVRPLSNRTDHKLSLCTSLAWRNLPVIKNNSNENHNKSRALCCVSHFKLIDSFISK